VTASLAGDHRAIDGLTGSNFLAETQRALDDLLQEETT
jgi:pyruvate/2-oxoglutarate dehydrogenase complex dihydrolipoamide acyltransferase (E2) component